MCQEERNGEQRVDLLNQGKSFRQIAEELGCSKGTISYHANRIGHVTPKVPAYDWREIQEYYEDGHSYTECKAKFGFHSSAWAKAIKRGDIISNGERFISTERIIAGKGAIDTQSVKKRLFKLGIKQKKCEECGIESWNAKPISFDLHHINGINDDHRLENLKILCPNCHSQTPSYKGGNKSASKKRKALME